LTKRTTRDEGQTEKRAGKKRRSFDSTKEKGDAKKGQRKSIDRSGRDKLSGVKFLLREITTGFFRQ